MVELKNPTYYKYKMTNKEGGEEKYFYNYKQLHEYFQIPRTTLFRILKGHKSKYLKDHNFFKVKLPRLELKILTY